MRREAVVPLRLSPTSMVTSVTMSFPSELQCVRELATLADDDGSRFFDEVL
jgi:hypothetical protein